MIHGDDLNEVNHYCNNLMENIAGFEAEKEMRIEKIYFENLKNNFEELETSINSMTFFSGVKVIIIKNISENINEKFKKILIENCNNTYTKILATSKTLGYRSSLKKFIDNSSNCLNIFINNNISEKNIQNIISEFNINFDNVETFKRLVNYANEVNLSEFREKLQKIKLFKYNNHNPLTIDEIDKIIFLQQETEMYELIDLMIEGNVKDFINSLNNYNKKINEITTTLIITNKILLQFHKILSDKNGVEFAINSFKPPIYSKRKNKIIKQIQKWNLYKVEKALIYISEADFKIRSSTKINYKQIFERTFINIIRLL